jgi:hypothetical protein
LFCGLWIRQFKCCCLRSIDRQIGEDGLAPRCVLEGHPKMDHRLKLLDEKRCFFENSVG